MDYKRIQIDSLAIGVKDVYNIDLTKDDFINSYLTVGHLSSNYDSINRTNFGSISPVTFFTINVTTSNVTQNIKYCILGDVNLSHSSQ